MNADILLQELAKIGNVNTDRLQIIVREMSDKEFVSIYGAESFARINITVPKSLKDMFGGKDE